jgi:SAM-dependent methyltransferase
MTGVDIAEGMIARAREAEIADHLGINYEAASITDMSIFGDRHFDAAFSTMALMDCADYPGAVAELYRVLKPGGMLAFSILHPCFVFDMGAREWIRDENGDPCALKLGDYFRRGVGEESWCFGSAPETEDVEPFNVIYFDRTLSDYLNPLCETGFIIEVIAEPYPSEEACEAEPRLRKHQLVPISLMVRARRGDGDG